MRLTWSAGAAARDICCMELQSHEFILFERYSLWSYTSKTWSVESNPNTVFSLLRCKNKCWWVLLKRWFLDVYGMSFGCRWDALCVLCVCLLGVVRMFLGLLFDVFLWDVFWMFFGYFWMSLGFIWVFFWCPIWFFSGCAWDCFWMIYGCLLDICGQLLDL